MHVVLPFCCVASLFLELCQCVVSPLLQYVSFQLTNNAVVNVSGICDSEMTLNWNGNNSLTMKFGSVSHLDLL